MIESLKLLIVKDYTNIISSCSTISNKKIHKFCSERRLFKDKLYLT